MLESKLFGSPWPSLDVQVSRVTARRTLRSTSLLPPVVVPHLRPLRPLKHRPRPWEAALPTLRPRGSRCPPWSRCSRNRTASRQSRSLRVWIQWGSCRSGSTGAYPSYDLIAQQSIWTCTWHLDCYDRCCCMHSTVNYCLNLMCFWHVASISFTMHNCANMHDVLLGVFIFN